MNYTDIDIIRFLTNVECLEGLFDTWGTFGHGFINNLELGGPTPIGAKAANLTEATRPAWRRSPSMSRCAARGAHGQKARLCLRAGLHLCHASVRFSKCVSGRAADGRG